MQYEPTTGRYGDNVEKMLHAIAMKTDDAAKVGDTKTNGWQATLLALDDETRKELDQAGHGYDNTVAAIVIEDKEGFVTVEPFKTDQEAGDAWDEYVSDAENGDDEANMGKALGAANKKKSDDSKETDVKEASKLDMGPKSASLLGGGPSSATTSVPAVSGRLVRKPMRHQGQCSGCSREGKVYTYGHENPLTRNVSWKDHKAFCNADCYRSHYGMTESKHDPTLAGRRVGLGLRLVEAGMAPQTALDKVLSGDILTETDALLMSIQSGDNVTVKDAAGNHKTGLAVKRGADGWILDVNGASIPATASSIVSVDPVMPEPPMGMEPMEIDGDMETASELPDLEGSSDEEDEEPEELKSDTDEEKD